MLVSIDQRYGVFVYRAGFQPRSGYKTKAGGVDMTRFLAAVDNWLMMAIATLFLWLGIVDLYEKARTSDSGMALLTGITSATYCLAGSVRMGIRRSFRDSDQCSALSIHHGPVEKGSRGPNPD